MNNKLCFVIVCLLAVACTNAAMTPTLAPTFTPVPAPTSEPTPAFVEGQFDIPEGKYLFMEYWIDQESSAQCPLELLVDPPVCSYWRYRTDLPGRLDQIQELLSRSECDLIDSSVKSWLGIATYFAHQGHGSIFPIRSLPYLSSAVIIHSVVGDTVVVELRGKTRLLESGQTLTDQTDFASGKNCKRTVTEYFTNYGLSDGIQPKPKQ